jgi:hypothetical protein
MKITQILFCSYLLSIVGSAQSLNASECLGAICDSRCPNENVHAQGSTETYKVVICRSERSPTHYLGENKITGSSILLPLTSFNDSTFVARNGKYTYTLIISENSPSRLIIKARGKKARIENFIMDTP